MERTGQGVAEVNGTRLAYEVTGSGSPVVFVHGFALDQRLWDDQIAAFATDYRVVRYDLRGFGRSAPPRPGESYTHADDLRALMAYLGIERATVVGLSLGGWVALEFTVSYLAMVSALVLVDAALREYRYDPAFGKFMGKLYGTGRTDPAAAKKFWLDHPFFAVTRSRPDAAERMSAMVDDYSGWHWANEDPHPPLVPPAVQRLKEVTVPTLVVIGELDLPDFRGIADFLVAGIPTARRAEIPAAGHLPNMEEPAAFNGAVLGFLGGRG
jgi:pimeloyl-ACP methyl ester carboxylesterase